jgi:predicted nucleic acid-binding protein
MSGVLTCQSRRVARSDRIRRALSPSAQCKYCDVSHVARLMHRRSDDLIEDAMIAATARVHGLRVVTRNVKDFKHFGVAF